MDCKNLVKLGILASLVAAPAYGLPNVLVMAASSSSGPDVQMKIMGTGAFGKVDLVQVQNVTPTVAELKMYDAVIFYSFLSFKDKDLLGDNLAAYLEQGGGVVMFDYETQEMGSYQIGGRWQQMYTLMTLQDSLSIEDAASSLGKINEMGSPLLTGVNKFGCAANPCHHLSSPVKNGGVVVAEWADGKPLVIRGNVAGRNLVELNFFGPSDDTGIGEWDATTDGAILMKNALLYVMGGSVRADKGSLAFADTNVGDASAPQTITYTNAGMMPATITTLALSGANPNDFTVVPAAPLPQTLAPNATFKANVQFTPTGAKGARSALLKATVMGQMNTVDTSLSGNSLGGALAILPNPVRLGGTKLNGQLSTMISITNTTNANVTINSVAVTMGQAEFSVMPALNPPLTLVPNSSLAATIRFNGNMAGNRMGILAITPANLPVQNVNLFASAGDPKITVNNGTLIFGNQHVAAPSAPSLLSVTNSGFSDLTVNNISLSGANAADFTVTAMLPAKVAPGASFTYSLVFKPSAVGMRAATVSITSDDPGMPSSSFTVGGTGVAFMQTLTPMTLDFGSVKGGVASMPMTATLANQSNAPLQVNSVTIGGPNAMFFTLQSAPPMPTSVPPMGTLAMPVVFRPGAAGMASATLTVTIDDPNMPNFVVALKGVGVAGKLEFMPMALDFGGIPLGMTSMAKKVTITNGGSSDLTVTKIALNGTDKASFALAALPMLPAVVKPMTSATFDVTFSPAAHAAATAAVEITSDDPMTPLAKINLTGVGTQAGISVNPLTLDFGTLPVSVASMPKAVTITNTGDADLVLLATIMGSNAKEFSANRKMTFTIPPGKMDTVDVTFSPTTAVSAMATLTLTPTDMMLMPVDVKLSGMGVSSAISVMPAMHNFGLTTVGTTSPPATITIKNTAKVPLDIASIMSTSALYGVDTSKTSLMLAADGTTTFDITFSPVEGGPATPAQVLILLRGGTKPIATVNVQGEGLVSMMPPGGMPRGGCAIGRGPIAPLAGGLALLALAALLLRRRRR